MQTKVTTKNNILLSAEQGERLLKAKQTANIRYKSLESLLFMGLLTLRHRFNGHSDGHVFNLRDFERLCHILNTTPRYILTGEYNENIPAYPNDIDPVISTDRLRRYDNLQRGGRY